MAEIRGFRALRYDSARVGALGRVVCPPYDIVSTEEAAELRAASPFNAIHLELPEAEPGDPTGMSRYRRAAAALAAWQRAGALRRDSQPGLYAVEEEFSWQGIAHRRRGVLAAVRLAEWDERVVLPHERTLTAPKADRLELLRACGANISPVFLLHPPRPEAEEALWRMLEPTAPRAEVALSDGRHERLWALPGDAGGLSASLVTSPLYVADGHHRYETALRYRDERRAADPAARDAAYECVLAYLVSMADPGLLVLPTHRCVPAGLVDAGAVDALVAERFTVVRRAPLTAAGLPAALAALAEFGRSHTTFALYQHGQLAFLQPRPDAARWLPSERHAAWRALDVAQLESLLLAPLLGPTAAELLVYTRDAAEALAAVNAGQADLAVLVNPTHPNEIAAVADAAERMPQKSTYFYPKLSTGLAMHLLDGDALR